jgi:hypothetical protein
VTRIRPRSEVYEGGELSGAVATFDCAQERCSLIAEGAMMEAPGTRRYNSNESLLKPRFRLRGLHMTDEIPAKVRWSPNQRLTHCICFLTTSYAILL